MTSLPEWKLAEKIKASGRRGIVAGICIAVFIILAIVITIWKINWLKRTFCCGCDCDDFDEYYLDDDTDESGYANEKDFV